MPLELRNLLHEISPLDVPPEASLEEIAAGIEELRQRVNERIRALLEFDSRVADTGGGGSTVINQTTLNQQLGAPIQPFELTLTAPSTAIGIPSIPVGWLILYIFRQDATGGRLISWDPGFRSPGQPGGDGNTYSIVIFYKRTDLEMYQVTPFVKNLPAV